MMLRVLQQYFLITFPKFHMMLYASGTPGDDTGWLNLQQPVVHFLYTTPAIPSFPTVFGIKP